jgi:hypothetical protein
LFPPPWVFSKFSLCGRSGAVRAECLQNFPERNKSNMGKRREQRTPIALPVKVIIPDKDKRTKTEMACTLNVSPRGARLGGIRNSIKAGDIVTIQRGKEKAMYRVAWVGTREEKKEGQVGFECIEPGASIWGIDLWAGEDER